MNVLVLGHQGMLGHMVCKYYATQGITIETTNYRWDTPEFKEFIKNSKSDCLVNCIGAIPQKKPAWETFKSINILLPDWLCDNFDGKVLHPTTDCEFSGKLEVGKLYNKFAYKDATDQYGVSKGCASAILMLKNNGKQLRTSIIGPELKDKVSLLEWFLSNDDVKGYDSHYWIGITTLEWAKQSIKILYNWDVYDKVVQIGVEPISKYDLLHLINRTFQTDKKITRVTVDFINKCLQSDYKIDSLIIQLNELKEFQMEKPNVYGEPFINLV